MLKLTVLTVQAYCKEIKFQCKLWSSSLKIENANTKGDFTGLEKDASVSPKIKAQDVYAFPVKTT